MSTNPPTTNSVPSSLATVFAGETVEVCCRSVVPGETVRFPVRVHQLPVRRHVDYIAFAHDEAKSIEFCCTNIPGEPTLPDGWVDALLDESHLLLASKVKELNFTRATATLARSAAVAKTLMAQSKNVEAFQA